MGKDFGSWQHQLQPNGQFPLAKSLKLPFELGMQNAGIPCATHCTNEVPPSCALTTFGYLGLPDLKPGHLEEPQGSSFYGLPHFGLGVAPNVATQEKFLPKFNLPAALNPSTAGDKCAQKQFLVFDQSGNKTTMMLSSGIISPIQRLGPWIPETTGYYNMSGGEFGITSNGHYNSGPNLTDEFGDGDGTDEGDDMHENTEEIDALLYSDDEDNYSDDGEEASTGHSPSTMTAYEKQDWLEEDDLDEVASSGGPVKRQKLSDSGYEAATITNTGSSVKPRGSSSEYEDDAESSCAGVKPMSCHPLHMGPLSGNKRLRREKIRETVSILQTILPGGKDRDAVMVLDEAIDYLRSLRFKARSSGLSAP